ncbi:MAG: hypothetical protein ABIA75_04280 [Candidatus Neomarinimicrobiota bacterium]
MKIQGIILILFISLIVLVGTACVGPAEPDDGLLENLTAVVNTATAFTLHLKADEYTFDEDYTLSMTYTDTNAVLSKVLLVENYTKPDSAYIYFYRADNTLLTAWVIGGAEMRVETDSVKHFAPKKIKFQGEKFTGVIEFILAKD